MGKWCGAAGGEGTGVRLVDAGMPVTEIRWRDNWTVIIHNPCRGYVLMSVRLCREDVDIVYMEQSVGEQEYIGEQMDVWLTVVSQNPNVFNALRCALHKDYSVHLHQ